MGETSFKIMLIIFNVIFIAFIGAIVVFIREYHRKKKAYIEQIKTIDILHKKELLKTQMEIQVQTMKSIGREIHDNVGQKLTLSSLYLQQLTFENKAPQINNSIANINTIISESLDELRHLSKSLMDDTIDNNSISDLIENECRKANNLKKYRVRFKNNLEHTPKLYEVKSILLRITQEFIQNSIKHAGCKNIDISLYENEGKLHLKLQDDGKGFDVENLKTNGIGIKNMKKRTEMIDGIFNLESNTKNGTKLTLIIPI
ncbi:signal transduction histidine kinase [Aquimarina sp. EL_43]|uniref:sensor histidine kinase n=1 Tax=unclassified Aquimarina TaxID=2627091 RepID=UPI0018CA3C19|nr:MULTISPECIES: ATP-binding protein [unclassified Aquimarina]MBG6132217.1 signal transduction histidine kinase [Aquimarina sp. EL_35]MBG6153014.1 signal transduction histidine kinase [Aquimarina sp. EL_32]MBG6171021.1 signal transduction histidine kinase [Aquimarina sp. EL_43]